MATCALKRDTPRTCTVDNANEASSGDNVPNYVADLAIDPVTKQVDFSNSVPILTQEEVTPQLRENMKQLLDIIMEFFQDELTKLENGELKEEDLLLSPYVQEDDTSTKHPTRSLPEGFKRRRA